MKLLTKPKGNWEGFWEQAVKLFHSVLLSLLLFKAHGQIPPDW
jgi:hypothetical protein